VASAAAGLAAGKFPNQIKGLRQFTGFGTRLDNKGIPAREIST
jgi:hypothetical protein